MKKFFDRHREVLTVFLLLFGWRIFFLIIQMNRYVIKMREGYLGLLRIANFDGVYYLTIATYGYHGIDQAFFPLFPIAINGFIRMGFEPIGAALIVVAGSLFGFLYILAKLVKIDFPKTPYIWVLILYLSFPTSFFLGSIYTESFFLFLVLLSFYFARKKRILIASIFASLASAARVIGIFMLPALFYEIFEEEKNTKRRNLASYLPILLVPIGLLSYMFYLWKWWGDPLLFIHQQPLFGAGRSGGGIILLPQVIFRYIKIFISIPKTDLIFWVSVAEFIVFTLGLLLLYLAYKKGIRKSYIIFSACAIIFPTLSGTLSSMPRYILASFVIFIYLGLIKNIYFKLIIIILGLTLQAAFAILFLQGYFIA